MTDRNTLKGYFEQGDKPTEPQFAELIDSMALSATETTVNNGAGLWSSTYTTVCANSASWDANGESNTASNITAPGEGLFAQKNGVDLEFKTVVAGTNVTLTPTASTIVFDVTDATDLTEVAAASGDWNSTYTTVSANSAIWNQTADLSEVAAASGGWNSAETTVAANSATDWSRSAARNTIIIDSGPVSVGTADSGSMYVVSAVDAGEVLFNLPAATISNLGVNYSFCKFATGSYIALSAVGVNAMIDDSGATATIYSGSSAAELSGGQQAFASIEVQLVLPNQWHVTQGRKVWTTTEYA